MGAGVQLSQVEVLGYDPSIDTKRLQMLTEVAPPAANVAVLYNPDTAPYAALMVRSVRGCCQIIGRDGTRRAVSQ